MKAVILAAGRGTRMGPLTQEVPKPMLRVRGRPLLESILLALKETGVSEVVIVTGYRAEVIESYFRDGEGLGLAIEYVRQGERAGTGAAAAAACRSVGQQPFMLLYGDILTEARVYKAVWTRFEQSHADAVITVIEGEDVKKGGFVWFDAQMRLLGLLEKPTAQQIEELMLQGHIPSQGPFWYNAGIYAFTPKLFEYLDRIGPSPRGEYELTDAIQLMVEDGCTVVVEPFEGLWVDVRDPEILAKLNRCI